MLNFSFYSPTRFIFGSGTETEAGTWARYYGGTRILMVYGGGSASRSGLLDRVRQSLTAAGAWFGELGGVIPNPRDTLVYAGIDQCRRENIDLVLGIGGGSALDTAKAIAIGACYEGDFWDFYGRGAKPVRRLPLGTLVTLPATGSEGSNSSVIVRASEQTKRGLRSDLNRPDFSIINPELTYSLPPWQIACGTADILSHIFERYLSRTTDTDLTDRLCEAVIAAVIASAPAALADPQAYGPRANLMWASMIAHNGSLGVGRQEDWSAHALEHELSGRYDTAHGAGLAALYPAWLQYVLPQAPAKPAQLANRVFGVPLDPAHPEHAAAAGIRQLARFFRSLGLPVNLRELGARQADIPDMVARVKRNPDQTCGFYLPLHDADILAIFKLAFDWSESSLDAFSAR
jgi:alcohol dehydrogenase